MAHSDASIQTGEPTQAQPLHAARRVEVPATVAAGQLLLVPEVPAGGALQVTVLNFAAQPVQEVVRLAHSVAGGVVDRLTGARLGTLGADGNLAIRLAGHSGMCLVIEATG